MVHIVAFNIIQKDRSEHDNCCYIFKKECLYRSLCCCALQAPAALGTDFQFTVPCSYTCQCDKCSLKAVEGGISFCMCDTH